MSLQRYKIKSDKVFSFWKLNTVVTWDLRQEFFVVTVVALGCFLFCLIAAGTCKKRALK